MSGKACDWLHGWLGSFPGDHDQPMVVAAGERRALAAKDRREPKAWAGQAGFSSHLHTWIERSRRWKSRRAEGECEQRKRQGAGRKKQHQGEWLSRSSWEPEASALTAALLARNGGWIPGVRRPSVRC